MSLTLESNNIAMGILLIENQDATFEDFKKRSVFKLSKLWNKEEWGEDKKNYFKETSKEDFKTYLIGYHKRNGTTNESYIKR